MAVGELGLKPHEFWNLTYAEFAGMVSGYQRRQKKHVNELIYLAWHTEMFARQKKLPALRSCLRDTEERHMQTDGDMLQMCKILNAAFGGEVVET